MANNDRIYEAYNGSLGELFQQATHNRIDWIIKKTENSKKILDIGCSQGIVSLLLARKGANVTGVDIQSEAIDFANDLLKQKYSDVQGHVRFICSDIMNLTLEEKFNCIIITEVIEHLSNPNEILHKASTMLAPNGIMIISTPFGVCLHPDHKTTYYISNFTDLLIKSLSIRSIEFVESWMGAICTLPVSNDSFSPLPYFIDEEDEFEARERKYLDQIATLRNHFQTANNKYKAALQNYATAKQWLESKDEKLKTSESKIEELTQQINEANIKCKEAQDNYETAKGWVASHNDKLSDAEATICRLQEKLTQSETAACVLREKLTQAEQAARLLAYVEEQLRELNHSLQQSESTAATLRQKLAQSEQRLAKQDADHQLLQQQNETLKTHGRSTEKELSDCLKDYDLIIMNTEQLMAKITRLEVQSSALVQKNHELQAKIDIIDQSKIGRLGIKLYHLYKRIKNR